MVADLILWPMVALGDAVACLLHPVPASRILIKYLVAALLVASVVIGLATILVVWFAWSLGTIIALFGTAYMLMIAAGLIGRTLLRY